MQPDTIAAIATPPGTGGIGVIRMSGPDVRRILDALFVSASPAFRGFRPRTLHRGTVCGPGGEKLDDCLAVFMPGPRSFTGEDVAEWHCHGGPALLGAVLESVLAAGAHLAERGEFTRRAFLNGRLDLTQAEAVAEMIAAPSREGARLAAARLEGLLGRRMAELKDRLEDLRAQVCLAVDFPEEEVECLSPRVFLEGVREVDAAVAALVAGFERTRCWREGVLVALAGPVNAGKSSLLNALLGRERAIVTEHPGTTRDFLEEPARLAGLPVRLVDTAGLRAAGEPVNPVEAQGIRLGRDKAAAADVALLLFDGNLAESALAAELPALAASFDPDRVILVWNKSDVAPPPPAWPAVWPEAWLKAWSAAWLRARRAGGSVPPASPPLPAPRPPRAAPALPVLPDAPECAPPPAVAVSARTGAGLEELAALVRRTALARSREEEAAEEAVPNLRQTLALKRLRAELAALAGDVAQGVPYDVCAVRLESAVAVLAEITGVATPEDVLNRIFASFCIGK